MNILNIDYESILKQEKSDVADLLSAGCTQPMAGNILDRLKQASKLILPAANNNTNSKKDDFLKLILSHLPKDVYKQHKKDASKFLELKINKLDSEIKELRTHIKTQDKDIFPEVIPWKDSVDLSELLCSLEQTFSRYVILPEHASIALSLWTIFTWMIDQFGVAPILLINSPEKRCGKTTLASLLNHLVCKPYPSANITAAALFRLIEKYHPTPLIDEADTFLSKSNETAGIINSGHTRSNAFVIRTTGDDHEPTKFSTWSAKVIFMIKTDIPDTLMDRSINIKMRRKLENEVCESLRYNDAYKFTEIAEKLARVAEDYADEIGSIRPKLPSKLSDRAKDNWEPLLAIAKYAGQEWLEKATDAAIALSNIENDVPSEAILLLSDIKDIFEECNQTRIFSRDLVKELCKDDEKPWITYNKGKPITPRDIAKMVGNFGIESKDLRIGISEKLKGYQLDSLKEAFKRYLNLSETTIQIEDNSNQIYIDKESETLETLNDLECQTECLAVSANLEEDHDYEEEERRAIQDERIEMSSMEEFYKSFPLQLN